MKVEDCQIGLVVVPHKCLEDLCVIKNLPDSNGNVRCRSLNVGFYTYHVDNLDIYDEEKDSIKEE